jgi:putative cell wall-binding protein
MRRVLSLFVIFVTALAAFSAAAAEHLDGVVPLARDDVAALAQVRATPERHVLLYFGDQAN